MQISNIQNYNQNFGGYYAKSNIIREVKNSNVDFCDDIISKKAIKLFRGLSDYIEDIWTKIRKGELDESALKFSIEGKRGAISTFKPIYGANKPIILMDIDSGKYTQRFLFDRKNPTKFKYEKKVLTDYGSATLKSFDSELSKNKEIEKIADENLTKCLPDILPYKYIKDQFGYFNEYSKCNF